LRWASSAPVPAAERDDLLWYFATDSTFRYVDRTKALKGARLMMDPEWRARAFDHVVLIWARTEPQAAAQYIQNCDSLSAKQKGAIVAKIGAMKKT
jgi:hypothetical protein